MKKIIRFFIPRNNPLWGIPRSQFQQANATARNANTHELILIRQMYARNTVEAKLIMKKYNAKTAYDVIRAVDRKKPTVRDRATRGLRKFIRKLEGSTRGKPDPGVKDFTTRLPL